MLKEHFRYVVLGSEIESLSHSRDGVPETEQVTVVLSVDRVMNR